MKKEKTYTEQDAEEFAQNEWSKLIKRKMKGLSTRVFNGCSSKGLAAMKIQCKWLAAHPNTLLPVEEIDHEETVQAWFTGITDYEESIGL